MRGVKPQTTTYPKFPKLDYIFDLNASSGEWSMYCNAEGLPHRKGETYVLDVSSERPLNIGYIETCFYLKSLGLKSGVYVSAKEEIPLFDNRGFCDKGTPAELRERHKLTTNAMIIFVTKKGNHCGLRLTGTQRAAFMDWKKDVVNSNEELSFFEDNPDFQIMGWDIYNYSYNEGGREVKKNSKVPKFVYGTNVEFPADSITDLISKWCNYRGIEVPTEAPTTEAPTTEAPTTEAPTTEAPTTEAPTTEVPTEPTKPKTVEKTAIGNFETTTDKMSPPDDMPF